MGNDLSLFWQLVEKEHHRARAYCYRLSGGGEDGDDLYQESVVTAYNGFSGLRQTASFQPWFYRIINNNFKSRFRNPWWKRILSLLPEHENVFRTENPSALYEARQRINKALEVLSVDDRILVTLAELEGWKISELAELTLKTEGTIKMRLSRARQKMRRRLRRRYSENMIEKFNRGLEEICIAAKPEKD
ncbi:MAG: RNA polymerase sigma factor [candidate division Zixibacteria bacterium]|nr:RNA polymerase sigma factor [candidate division Zixibacteria bacterium]